MKKHKRKIQTGIVIGIFSVIIIACLISIFSRMYTENKEKEAFRHLQKSLLRIQQMQPLKKQLKSQIY